MKVIHPEGWARARGYSNGIVASGTTLHIAGQIGWDASGNFVSDDLVAQFEQALANVLAIVRAAGGSTEDVVSMTVYTTTIATYRTSLRPLSDAWRRQFGRHYPAMALVGVTELVEPRALVEVQAVAVLPEASP